MKRTATLILTTLALLALPAAADAHRKPISVARGQQAIERQLPGYAATRCYREDSTVVCTITGPWLEEEGGEGGVTVAATANARRAHGRIFVEVVGFEGVTSERG